MGDSVGEVQTGEVPNTSLFALLYQTREDMAESKGLLQAFVGDISARVSNLEKSDREQDMRLNAKKEMLGRIDERVISNTERIGDLEDNNDARQGKIYGTIGAIGALVATVVAVYNVLGGR